MKSKLLIFFAVFLVLALLANWFWFPEYLLFGVFVVAVIVTIYGFFRGVINTFNDSKK